MVALRWGIPGNGCSHYKLAKVSLRKALFFNGKILYNPLMRFANIADFFLDSLELGPRPQMLQSLLMPIKSSRPRVLLYGGLLRRSLRKIDCHLETPNTKTEETPDVICGQKLHKDLRTTLLQWKSQLTSGGLVLLVSFRSEMPKEKICAAFLHAGLREPVQEMTRALILTAGLVFPSIE